MTYTRMLLGALTFALAIGAPAAADDRVHARDALRIVVLTDDEGIHYEGGCGFYELREHLAAYEDQASPTAEPEGDALYEMVLLGKSGNDQIFVGDHWIRTRDGTAPLTPDSFSRISDLVEYRRSSGVARTFLKASLRRASKRVQDPLYVEENRCTQHDFSTLARAFRAAQTPDGISTEAAPASRGHR